MGTQPFGERHPDRLHWELPACLLCPPYPPASPSAGKEQLDRKHSEQHASPRPPTAPSPFGFVFCASFPPLRCHRSLELGWAHQKDTCSVVLFTFFPRPWLLQVRLVNLYHLSCPLRCWQPTPDMYRVSVRPSINPLVHQEELHDMTSLYFTPVSTRILPFSTNLQPRAGRKWEFLSRSSFLPLQ